MRRIVDLVIFSAIAWPSVTAEAPPKPRVDDGNRVLEGIWVSSDEFVPSPPWAEHGTRSQLKHRWHIKGNDVLIYAVEPTGDQLTGWLYITLNPKADPKEVNIVNRPVPPRDGRPLLEEERSGKVAIHGIYRIVGDTLDIFYPENSDMPRPKAFPKERTTKGHYRDVLKFKHPLPEDR